MKYFLKIINHNFSHCKIGHIILYSGGYLVLKAKESNLKSRPSND